MSDPMVTTSQNSPLVFARLQNHVIVSNDLWQVELVALAFPKEKSSVFRNHVDPAIFCRRQSTRNDGSFIVLYPGCLDLPRTAHTSQLCPPLVDDDFTSSCCGARMSFSSESSSGFGLVDDLLGPTIEAGSADIDADVGRT